MFNQRLLTALLAVTTVTTTVAVNAPSSYGQGATDDAVRGANNCVRRQCQEVLDDVVDKVGDAVQQGRRWYRQHGKGAVESGKFVNDNREDLQRNAEQFRDQVQREYRDRSTDD